MYLVSCYRHVQASTRQIQDHPNANTNHGRLGDWRYQYLLHNTKIKTILGRTNPITLVCIELLFSRPTEPRLLGRGSFFDFPDIFSKTLLGRWHPCCCEADHGDPFLKISPIGGGPRGIFNCDELHTHTQVGSGWSGLTVPSLAENRSLMFAFTSFVPETWAKHKERRRRQEAPGRQKEGE